MKNITQTISGKMKIFGVLFLFTAALTSCLKDNNDNVVPPQSALISVINASPDSQPVDFYLDNNRANNSSIQYGNGLDYLNAITGKRTAAFYNSGSTTKIKSDTMTLRADKAYTLYLTNLVATPDFVLLNDDVQRPAAGQASIRFVHVSANTPAVDVVTSTGTSIAPNKAYKEASAFIAVQAAKYTLQVRQAGTTTVLATLTDKDLLAGGVYTVWLQGVQGATDDVKVLTAKIQRNALFNN